MSNMSYCRFQNTVGDLADCSRNMDAELEGRELKARAELVQLCGSILYELGVSIDEKELTDAIANLPKDTSFEDEDEDTEEGEDKP